MLDRLLPRLPIERMLLFVSLALALLHAIHVGIARYLVHPGRERAAVLIAMPVFQNTEENVLRQIFAELAIAREAQEIAEQRAMMALEQHGHLG